MANRAGQLPTSMLMVLPPEPSASRVLMYSRIASSVRPGSSASPSKRLTCASHELMHRGTEVISLAATAYCRLRGNRSRTSENRCRFCRQSLDRSGPLRLSKLPLFPATPMRVEMGLFRRWQIFDPPAPVLSSAGTRRRSKTREAQKSENSTAIPMVGHRHRFATDHSLFHTVEQIHSCPSRREILLELDIPLAAIPFSKPFKKSILLIHRQGFDLLLNLNQVHAHMISIPRPFCVAWKP